MRDSSAMKTIAVMTLVFLPATFLSVSEPSIRSLLQACCGERG
jgi:hypothetical protein